MKTYTISTVLSDEQAVALDAHVARQTTFGPGPKPGDILVSRIFPTTEAFLADQFASSIMHLIPASNTSEANALQAAAEAAQRAARAAQVSAVQVKSV